MISALSSVIDAATPEEARKIMEKIADPLGTFYRFSLAASTFKRVQMTNENGKIKVETTGQVVSTKNEYQS
jgi:hypothetical protein